MIDAKTFYHHIAKLELSRRAKIAIGAGALTITGIASICLLGLAAYWTKDKWWPDNNENSPENLQNEPIDQQNPPQGEQVEDDPAQPDQPKGPTDPNTLSPKTDLFNQVSELSKIPLERSSACEITKYHNALKSFLQSKTLTDAEKQKCVDLYTQYPTSLLAFLETDNFIAEGFKKDPYIKAFFDQYKDLLTHSSSDPNRKEIHAIYDKILAALKTKGITFTKNQKLAKQMLNFLTSSSSCLQGDNVNVLQCLIDLGAKPCADHVDAFLKHHKTNQSARLATVLIKHNFHLITYLSPVSVTKTSASTTKTSLIDRYLNDARYRNDPDYQPFIKDMVKILNENGINLLYSFTNRIKYPQKHEVIPFLVHECKLPIEDKYSNQTPLQASYKEFNPMAFFKLLECNASLTPDIVEDLGYGLQVEFKKEPRYFKARIDMILKPIKGLLSGYESRAEEKSPWRWMYKRITVTQEIKDHFIKEVKRIKNENPKLDQDQTQKLIDYLSETSESKTKDDESEATSHASSLDELSAPKEEVKQEDAESNFDFSALERKIGKMFDWETKKNCEKLKTYLSTLKLTNADKERCRPLYMQNPNYLLPFLETGNFIAEGFDQDAYIQAFFASYKKQLLNTWNLDGQIEIHDFYAKTLTLLKEKNISFSQNQALANEMLKFFTNQLSCELSKKHVQVIQCLVELGPELTAEMAFRLAKLGDESGELAKPLIDRNPHLIFQKFQDPSSTAQTTLFDYFIVDNAYIKAPSCQPFVIWMVKQAEKSNPNLLHFFANPTTSSVEAAKAIPFLVQECKLNPEKSNEKKCTALDIAFEHCWTEKMNGGHLETNKHQGYQHFFKLLECGAKLNVSIVKKLADAIEHKNDMVRKNHVSNLLWKIAIKATSTVSSQKIKDHFISEVKRVSDKNRELLNQEKVQKLIDYLSKS